MHWGKRGLLHALPGSQEGNYQIFLRKSKSSRIFFHFPTKEEWYVTIHIDGLEMPLQVFQESVRGVKDGETRIRNMGKACDVVSIRRTSLCGMVDL